MRCSAGWNAVRSTAGSSSTTGNTGAWPRPCRRPGPLRVPGADLAASGRWLVAVTDPVALDRFDSDHKVLRFGPDDYRAFHCVAYLALKIGGARHGVWAFTVIRGELVS